MVRYRLRFLLQEIDLSHSTIIGRGLDCQVTIDDPLVSRQHARILTDSHGAYVEDLRSRNGVKLNGVRVESRTALADGDRIRIGTQDFVFCRVGATETSSSKTTGILRLCADCRLPYPRELLSCPSCNSTEQTEEQTLTGTGRRNNWALELSLEGVQRALKLGRVQEGVRLMCRASDELEEILAAGERPSDEQLTRLATCAIQLSVTVGEATWANWVPELYERLDAIPHSMVVDRLEELADSFGAALRPALSAWAERLSSRALASSSESEAIGRLHDLRRRLTVGPGIVDGRDPPSAKNPSVRIS